MAKKVFTCQVFFYEAAAYYNKVDNPEKLAGFLEANREWKYLNVYEAEKSSPNKCGLYLRRIYSPTYLTKKENEKGK